MQKHLENMGAMSKKDGKLFAAFVFRSLGMAGWSMEWSSAGSHCWTAKQKITISNKLAWTWQVKQEILHEIAHALAPNDPYHWTEFLVQYCNLLSRFMTIDYWPQGKPTAKAE